MSDDLIKRLRQHRYNTWNDDLGPEPDKALAADRIEQLERERDVFETALDKTISVLDTQTQFLFQARTNLESVQAKLAKAVSLALEECPFRYGTGGYNDWWYDRRTTLAELEEMK